MKELLKSFALVFFAFLGGCVFQILLFRVFFFKDNNVAFFLVLGMAAFGSLLASTLLVWAKVTGLQKELDLAQQGLDPMGQPLSLHSKFQASQKLAVYDKLNCPFCGKDFEIPENCLDISGFHCQTCNAFYGFTDAEDSYLVIGEAEEAFGFNLGQNNSDLYEVKSLHVDTTFDKGMEHMNSEFYGHKLMATFVKLLE